MKRVELLDSKDGLTERQQDVFDWVVESRGAILRPYEVLLHAPDLAQPAAELGHQIRYEGELSDHDRELAILTTAKAHGCAFEWDSHVGLARNAGVSAPAITFLASGVGVSNEDLSDAEKRIIGFVRELCENSDVSDERFLDISEGLGDRSLVVELSALVGYYTFLAYVMKVAGAC